MKKLCYGELTNTAHILNIVGGRSGCGPEKHSPGAIILALKMEVLVQNNPL